MKNNILKNNILKNNIFFIKSFLYIFKKNPIPYIKFFFKNPLKYSFKIFTSFFRKHYTIKNDIYFFDIKDIKEFQKKDFILLISLPYCQKPLDCKVRFSKNCKNCKKNCIIGKWSSFFKNSSLKIPSYFFITKTANDLSKKLIHLISKYPQKKILFAIASCPFSIKMFKNFPYILGIKGIAFPLIKNTCHNFYHFEKAEKGLKTKKTDFNEKNFQNFIYSLKNDLF